MSLVRLYAPALALGLLASLGVGYEAAQTSAADLALGEVPAAAVIRGRHVYIQEGCIHCHSQYVRPGTHDVSWWGPARPLDRAERPLLVGARRQGPDLLAVGNRRNDVWHEIHLRDPRRLNPGSRMPSYEYLFAGDGQRGRDLVAYLASLGADTSTARRALTQAEPIARPPAPPSRLRGARLFSTYCAVCHGAAGRGDGPVAAKVGDPYLDLHRYGFHTLRGSAEPEDQALARIIRHGLPPTSMPGHEWLTNQQVADLVAFVQTLPARTSVSDGALKGRNSRVESSPPGPLSHLPPTQAPGEGENDLGSLPFSPSPGGGRVEDGRGGRGVRTRETPVRISKPPSKESR